MSSRNCVGCDVTPRSEPGLHLSRVTLAEIRYGIKRQPDPELQDRLRERGGKGPLLATRNPL